MSALSAAGLAVVVLAQALLSGTSTKTAYAHLPAAAARPVSAALVQPRPAELAQLPGRAPSWEVYPEGAWDAVVTPGRATLQVPILMYHYIRVPPDPGVDRLGYNLSVSPDEFREQMDYLAREGFHPITIGDLREYFEGHSSLPDRPVVLTFDDGYADLYTQAFPVLREHRFKAVAYIVSGFVGQAARSVTADQVREMDANGIEIGAHTRTHADLTKLGADQLQAEIAGSRTDLEGLVGHPVLGFCYPAGRFNSQVVEAVRSAGFTSATTTQEGSAHSVADRFTWSRVRVSGGRSLADFASGLQAHEDGVAPNRPEPIRIPRAYPLFYLREVAGLK